jgi:uncharacterized protein (TIGR03083 family)
MTEPHALAQAELRARVVELVQTFDPAVFDGPSPATPEWRMRDVLAHMVGVSDDVVSGRIEGIGSDPWTAAQVERHRGMSVAEMLDEWEEQGPRFEEMLAVTPAEITGQALFDAATHEHDLRYALGTPGARRSDAMVAGWDWLMDARSRLDAPAIRYVSEVGDAVAGAGAPVATVRAPFFELFRATTGRRTQAEIESYEWEPAPAVDQIIGATFFTLRSESLGE